MAIVIPARAGASYLRLDSLNVDLRPKRREDGAWSIPSGRMGSAQVYAYASAAARDARDAPVWSDLLQFLVADLAIVTTRPGSEDLPEGPIVEATDVTPAQLWAAVYALLLQTYPGGAADYQARGAAAGLTA